MGEWVGGWVSIMMLVVVVGGGGGPGIDVGRGAEHGT